MSFFLLQCLNITSSPISSKSIFFLILSQLGYFILTVLGEYEVMRCFFTSVFWPQETVKKKKTTVASRGSEAGCLLARMPEGGKKKLFPSLNKISNELSACGFGQR